MAWILLHVNWRATPQGQFTLPAKQSLKIRKVTEYGQELRVSAVDIATVFVLLTISTYKLHPAVILENISVAQLAKKLSQLIEAKGRVRLKCDGTRAKTRFRLSAKRTSPFKSFKFSRLLAGELYTSACRVCTACASLCSAVMWRLLVTHSISLFPLHFSSRASSCAITFQTHSTYLLPCSRPLVIGSRLWL